MQLSCAPSDRRAWRPQNSPLSDAARLIFGRASEIVISLVAVIILLTLHHSVLMSSTRILFAIGRDGLFWRRAAVVAGNDTPRAALACASAATVGLVLSGTVDA